MSAMQQYAIAGVGTAGVMRAGYAPAQLIVEIGQYWLPGASRRYVISDLSITQTGADAVSEASFQVLVRAADIRKPQDGMPVIIAVGTTQNRLFGGFLRIPSQRFLTADRRMYACEAVSWEHDLDRRLLNNTWRNTYTGDLLRTLLTEYPLFESTMFVERGVYLDEVVAQDESLLSLASRLAVMSNYLFYIDAHRRVHFHRRERIAARFDASPASAISQFRTGEDSRQLTNRVIVYYSVLRNVIETFPGDGVTKDFALLYAPHVVYSLTVNGADVGFGSHFREDNSAQDFSIEYKRGTVNTRAHPVLGALDALRISYVAKIPARLQIDHIASQEARAALAGGDGIYECVIRGADAILSKADALTRARAKLALDAFPRQSASYTRSTSLFAILQERLQPGMIQRAHDPVCGMDAMLDIERADIRVMVSDDGWGLVWQQDVKLGAASATLDALLRDALAPAVSGDPEATLTIDEEELYA